MAVRAILCREQVQHPVKGDDALLVMSAFNSVRSNIDEKAQT